MAGISEFQKSSVGGFGKTAESTTLWNVREFKLSDKKECITYRNLKIAVLEKPKIHRIITIPHEHKKNILKKLEMLGISEGTLFADDTDKVCSQIVKSLG